MKLLLELVMLENRGAKGGPLVGLGPAVLKFKHGSGFTPTPLPHVTVPVGVVTVPLDEIMYDVVFRPVTFCLFARLKKSVDNSSLYLSVSENILAMRKSAIQVLGKVNVFLPMSRRLAPPEPL